METIKFSKESIKLQSRDMHFLMSLLFIINGLELINKVIEGLKVICNPITILSLYVIVSFDTFTNMESSKLRPMKAMALSFMFS